MMRDIILNLLHNLGGQREVDRYIREYTQPGPANTTVVKVGGALISDELESLASSLAFLKFIGMSPIVVHGAGPQLSHALETAGTPCTWVDGLRITTPEVLSTALRVFTKAGEQLAESIDGHGVRARLITTGVFQAEPDDPDRLGLVGKVTGVHLAPVLSAIDAGYIPVLSSLGVTQDGQLLNINADTATRALCEATQPGKVLFLTQTGGIIGAKGKLISAVNLFEDRERLINTGEVSGGMARKLIEIDELLQDLPENTTVSITSPSNIARELFTHKGSGTLIRMGKAIEIHDELAGLDLRELGHLLESSFGRTLRADYLGSLQEPEIILAPYTAAAIVLDGPSGSYLDKFAVNARAQGNGIGAALWNKLIERHERLFWRSRADNPINAWYMNQADGMMRSGEWLVFWRGLDSQEDIAEAVRYAESHPVSFEPARADQEVAVG